jgi:hypothetical protein
MMINIGGKDMISYLKMATGELGRYLIDYFFQGYRRAAPSAIKIGSVTVLPLFLLMGCYAGNFTDRAAAAAPNSAVAPTAKLLFKSNFGPEVSLGAPRNLYAPASGGGGAWQDLTGTDQETGSSWPIAALGAKFSGVQLITVDPVTPSTVSDYITAEIRQVRGPKGMPVYELFQNVKKKAPVGIVPGGKGHAQAPLLIQRPWTIGDVTDLYVTYWFKHQADLAKQLDSTVSAGNWRAQFEFKTGGYLNAYPGDYRITTHVMKGSDGSLYWYTKGDNVANGPWPRVDYWVEANHIVKVPVDTWFKFEGYWHRSSGSDGRYWAAVNGQVIVDHHGPNMGDQGLPITRIFITNPYSGGHAPVESHMTGLEIWDGFPCGSGVSCY